MTDLKIEHWPLSRLHPYDKNPRKNDHAVARMVEVLKEFGFRVPILAKSDGQLVDGHLRYKAALAMGLETVPVILADDMTEAQIRAFRIMINRSATWADWDEDLLKFEMIELKDLDYDLHFTGFDDGELEKLLACAETIEFPPLSDGETVEAPSMTINFDCEESRQEALKIIKAYKKRCGSCSTGMAVLGILRQWIDS